MLRNRKVLKSKTWLPGVIALTLLAAVNIGYLWRFGWGFSGSTTAWGEYGDFVGGVLNPLAAIASVYFIYLTLKNQSDDARRNNISIKRSIKSQETQLSIASRQLRDSQAYRLIDLHHSMADRFRTIDGGMKGADAFALLRFDALNDFSARPQSGSIDSFYNAYIATANSFFSGEQKHIKQFVRSTIKIIESIDRLEALNTDKGTYMDLLKIQISQDELFALLFWYVSHQSDACFRKILRTHKIIEEYAGDMPQITAVGLARAIDNIREMGGQEI